MTELLIALLMCQQDAVEDYRASKVSKVFERNIIETAKRMDK